MRGTVPAAQAINSLHESDVPLIVYDWKGALPENGKFSRNADLLHFLLRCGGLRHARPESSASCRPPRI